MQKLNNSIRWKLGLIGLCLFAALTVSAQVRRVQYKPYIDLRPLHFGISVGMNMQDMELTNIGEQTITLEDGTEQTRLVMADVDSWNPGFSVGVLADLRLSKHLNLRLSPTMHFGSKHLTFIEADKEPLRQNMKNTYIAFPLDLKFSAERWNNYRPYLIGGINPTLNLTAKNQEYLALKRHDLYLEAGIGCDFYLPFFKLIPELKFCYSLSDAVDHSHADELKDANMRVYPNAVSRGKTKMIVLTFYFE